MTYRIGLIGSAGIGKSGVADKVAKRFGITFLRSKDITRPLLADRGFSQDKCECVEKFLSEKEMEYEIDEAEYQRLLAQAREDDVPIEKIRYCFEYRGQLFELDTYPFSSELAILELELESPDQQIYFPDYINVIKEVTGDDRYSNAALAAAAAFPE